MLKIAAIAALIALLVACDTKPAPAPTASTTPTSAAPVAAPRPAAATPSAGSIGAKLQELAGKDATNCGDVKAIAGDELKKASDCAMESAKSKKPFLVSYEMPGLSVGVAGNGEGKLFTVQSSEQAGKAMPPNSMPCPSELRLANSGRVTCMPAGSMGLSAGSANPHTGGMGAVAPGTPNPHAGGITTKSGAANPHATAPSKSH